MPSAGHFAIQRGVDNSVLKIRSLGSNESAAIFEHERHVNVNVKAPHQVHSFARQFDLNKRRLLSDEAVKFRINSK